MANNARVAQLAEHRTCNADVGGSIPLPGSKSRTKMTKTVELTDLSSITRNPHQSLTTIYIETEMRRLEKWLAFGETNISSDRNGTLLSAFLQEGVTDFEHDSAYALRLPLIGLTIDMVRYSTCVLTAWIDPNDSHNFAVPPPGYNPMNDPQAEQCSSEYCKDPHIIVPEHLYVPLFDQELYEAVRGKKVEIRIGPNYG